MNIEDRINISVAKCNLLDSVYHKKLQEKFDALFMNEYDKACCSKSFHANFWTNVCERVSSACSSQAFDALDEALCERIAGVGIANLDDDFTTLILEAFVLFMQIERGADIASEDMR